MASELDKAIQKLVEKEPGWKVFLPKDPSPIADSAGKAQNAVPKTASGGGDLNERAYADRRYHPRRVLRSTDGVLTFQFDPIKSVTMTDPTGAPVVWTFAEPN